MKSIFAILLCIFTVASVTQAIATYQFIVDATSSDVTKQIATTTDYTCELEKLTAPGYQWSAPEWTQCSLYTKHGYWYVFVAGNTNTRAVGCVINCVSTNTAASYDQNFFKNLNPPSLSSASSLISSTYFITLSLITVFFIST